MIGLLQMPEELILLVWDQVLLIREQVGAFAATCSHVHGLGKRHLEQFDLYRKFHIVRLRGDSPYGGEYSTLDILLDFVTEPSHALYVEEVRFFADGGNVGMEYEGQWHTILNAVLAKHWPPADVFNNAAQALLRHFRNTMSSNDSELCDLVAVFAVAVLCPQSPKIALHTYRYDWPLITSALTAILAMRSPEWTQFPGFSTFELIHYGDPVAMWANEQLEAFVRATKLPSIRSVLGHIIGHESSFGAPGTQILPAIFRGPPSSARELVLELCDLRTYHIQWLLADMPLLRRFCYRHRSIMGDFNEFCAHDICAVVENALGQTLGHLEVALDGRATETLKPIADLKGFPSLRSIELDLRWLICDEEQEITRFACGYRIATTGETLATPPRIKTRKLHDIFPPSIESIRLEASDLVNEFVDMVDGVAHTKAALLPNLRYVGLLFDKPVDSQAEAKIKAALEEVGVEYENIRGMSNTPSSALSVGDWNEGVLYYGRDEDW